MVSMENQRRGGVAEQRRLCPLLAWGAGSAEPRQPALDPAAPRPRREEGGKKGQGAKRTAGAAARDVEKGRFVPQKCRGSRMGSAGSSAPLLRQLGWGTAGRESCRRLREWGQSRGTRDTRSSCPGLPKPQQHLGGGVGAARLCSHLMLTPFATRKVCLEAQPGRCGGVGEEAVSQLKMKCSPGSSFARVRKSPGGGERRSDGTDGRVPGGAHSRSRAARGGRTSLSPSPGSGRQIPDLPGPERPFVFRQHLGQCL